MPLHIVPRVLGVVLNGVHLHFVLTGRGQQKSPLSPVGGPLVFEGVRPVDLRRSALFTCRHIVIYQMLESMGPCCRSSRPPVGELLHKRAYLAPEVRSEKFCLQLTGRYGNSI